MSGYLLRRTGQGGGWVAPAGSHRSYTRRREKARRFDTVDAAEADRCPDNEVIENA